MNTELILFAISLSGIFVAMLLYVVLGQVTVRKLRKNPQTKDELGTEFMSGWDILNVAGALAFPRWLNRKFRNNLLGGLYANADLLYKHTTMFDRALAVIFYVTWVFSVLLMFALILLSHFGFFD